MPCSKDSLMLCGRWCSYFSRKNTAYSLFLSRWSCSYHSHFSIRAALSTSALICGDAAEPRFPAAFAVNEPSSVQVSAPISGRISFLVVTYGGNSPLVSKCVTTQTTNKILNESYLHRGSSKLSVVSVCAAAPWLILSFISFKFYWV